MIEFRTLGTVDLRRADGASLESLVSGSKRLALLAYLALARPRGFHRRDTLLPLLYPESDQKHARGALRNLLHEARASLGREVIVNRGSEEIGIAEGALRCDAVAFEEALERGERRRAQELYRGDLLEGFHAPDVAPEFEHWLDRERDRLRRMAAEAAWALAEEDEAAGIVAGAAYWGRRAAALTPFDEAAFRRLLRLLERMGDRAGALRAYEEFAGRLAAEWDVAPSAETQAIIQAARANRSGPPRPAGQDEREPPSSAPRPHAAQGRAPGPTPPARASSPPRIRHLGVAVAGALAIIALSVAFISGSRSGDAAPVVAVGPIQTFGLPDSASLAPAIRSLLTTSLARSPELQVVSPERLHELLGPDRGTGHGSGAWGSAARQAGASVLIEGVIHARADGQYRLSLARRNLATGRVEDAAMAEGADPYALVDGVAVRLLAHLGVEATPLHAPGAATRSVAAYRLYEEGLRAYYAGDNGAAHRLLSGALEEDSLFAMAAYYRALSQEEVDHQAFRRDLGHAARLASRAPERERLLIRSAWAQEMDEPRQLALARTLALRYPYEPDGHLFLGRARMWGGDFSGALPHFLRVIRMDSLLPAVDAVRCRACDALQDLVTARLLADSLPQAEAVAREWVDRQPGSARAWHHLARSLEYQGRGAEALEARKRAAALRGDNPRDAVYPVVLALRAGDFREADRLLAARRRPGASLVQQNVLWYETLGLLYRGRLDEALRAARAYREMVLRAETPAQRRPWESVLEAVVLQEMGRAREAAQLWRAMAEYPYEPESPARSARHRAWTLAHLASALAAAGDTAALPALADSIQRLGAQSAYGRDPGLHHYVRGLLWMARGDTLRAAGQLRQAVFSTTAGYGRINLELGRALIAVGEPREAARVLGGTLRGPLDAGNLYVNPAEVHALLARALRHAGQPDSARVHERWLASARPTVSAAGP